MKAEPTVTIGPIQTGEIKAVLFDFDDEMEVSEAIVQVVGITVRPYSGKDPAPAGMLVSGPALVGRTVVQKVQHKLNGVIYVLQCTVRTDFQLEHTLSALLLSTAVA